jgi:site-specific DNA-methyltransferase (adenine-specific)
LTEEPLFTTESLFAGERHLLGDCREVLSDVADDSVQLIVTSPPYADARKKTYGGIHPDEYPAWFMTCATEFKRVLAPEGTFVLNIKERVEKGERHTYVLELIQAMRAAGWLWTEEWIWHKKNAAPGKWPNRFRDGWERVPQFNLQRKFDMYQDEVRRPIGDWAASRLANPSKNDQSRMDSASGSSVGRKVANWVGRDTVYPDNVLHFAAECSNREHPAVFPEELPTFFIKLFTKPGDIVLDPFEGSGTTGVAAIKLDRSYIGIDTQEDYIALAKRHISEARAKLAGQRPID